MLIAAGFALYVRERGRSDEIGDVVGMGLWCCPCPHVGEAGNVAVLTKDQWNVLVDLVQSGVLAKA